MVDSKLNKEAKHALNLGLQVLEQAMELALQKEDLDAIIAISDRLMLLYQHLSDKNVKKFKTGFSIIDTLDKKESNDDSESDES
jgi:hypothetical protein